jgi:hypothetical protein
VPKIDPGILTTTHKLWQISGSKKQSVARRPSENLIQLLRQEDVLFS